MRPDPSAILTSLPRPYGQSLKWTPTSVPAYQCLRMAAGYFIHKLATQPATSCSSSTFTNNRTTIGDGRTRVPELTITLLRLRGWPSGELCNCNFKFAELLLFIDPTGFNLLDAF